MPAYYVLSIDKENIITQLDINGVPLVIETDKNLHKKEQINRWIASTQNNLRVRLEWPQETPYEAGLAKFTIRLEALQPDQKVGTTPSLVEYTWPPTRSEEKYPFEIKMDFQADEVPPSQLWLKAESIEFNDAAKKQIFELLKSLHGALNQGEVDKAAKILDFKGVDSAQSHYISEDQARQQQREFIEFFVENPGKMQPLELEEFEFHVIADNRLVWVTKEHFQPVLQKKANSGANFLLPVYFAKIAGNWLIAR